MTGKVYKNAIQNIGYGVAVLAYFVK